MLDNLWMQALHISVEHKKLVILGGLMGEGVGSWAAKTELQQRRRDGWWGVLAWLVAGVEVWV